MRLMVKWYYLAVAVMLPLMGLRAGGGPDLYGYRWLDSNDTMQGSPVYAWVDLPAKMDAIRLDLDGDDQVSNFLPIGFNYYFYWTRHDKIKVATNGYLGFDPQIGLSLCLAPIPTPSGQGDDFIATLLSDLTFAENFGPSFPNPGSIWYWSNGVDSLVVSWENAPFWRDPGVFGIPDFHGQNTFQAILTAADSSIVFQYKTIDPSKLASNVVCQTNIEIGIENLTGNIGLAAWNNVLPTDTTGYAIRFFPPKVPGVLIPDPAPIWNANTENEGQFFLPGSSMGMTCGVSNLGNDDATSNIQLIGKVTPLDPATIIWRDTLIIPGLGKGHDTSLVFTQPAVIATPGQYYYEVKLSNPDDLNIQNNSNSVEISVVDVDQSIWHLTYCTLNPPDGAIGWGVGPDYGVGIFVDPPQAESEILGVDVFIVDFDNSGIIPVGSGFRLQIYDQDSLGHPGQLLYSKSVPKDSVISDNWNYIFFDSIVHVDSGGFFVGWLHDGDSISLGTEEFGPISRRTYEILAGEWAPYRDGRREDFLMVVNLQGPVAINEPQIAAVDFTVFPNPSRDAFTVLLNQVRGGTVSFQLFDLQGNMVFNESHIRIPAGPHYWSHSVQDIAPGLYFLQVQTQESKGVQKVCIRRD